MQARVFAALIKHLHLERSKLVSATHHGGDAIFRPIITTSVCPLFECDLNGHKSDSTYNTDLDINRLHLLATFFKSVLSPTKSNPTALGTLSIPLGGVSVIFKAEIKPYERYSISSRILTWDDKWLYIISHFTRYKKTIPGHSKSPVVASAISKYVFKRKRLTIPPEQVLTALHLLPARPHERSGSNVFSAIEKDVITGAATTEWTWDRIQAEKASGYKIASHFAALDQLHDATMVDTFKPLQTF